MCLTKPIASLLGTAALIVPLLSAAPAARAFTATDAYNVWYNFNWNFYVNNGGNDYYLLEDRWHNGSSRNGIWEEAELIEMAVDRAARSHSTTDYGYVTNLINGFDSKWSHQWTTKTTYNDDVMWACLAHLRAWLVVPNAPSAWANDAANNFWWVYNGGTGRSQPQYDSTYGGGMWWTTDHSATGSKNACVNSPAALVGYYCWKIYNQSVYYNDGFNCYWWAATYLYQPSGLIYDSYNGSGVQGNWDLSYNVGTFIGAAYYYGHNDKANAAANYFMNTICQGSYLPWYSQNCGNGACNNAGFNGIFLRWMCFYMQQTGQQSTYQTWLYNNANAALKVVNATTGCAWDCWWSASPGWPTYSWQCSPAVVALQVLPPQ